MQPTGVLDALVSQGSNALVDIRSAADKEEAGVPDLADPSEWRGQLGWGRPLAGRSKQAVSAQRKAPALAGELPVRGEGLRSDHIGSTQAARPLRESGHTALSLWPPLYRPSPRCAPSPSLPLPQQSWLSWSLWLWRTPGCTRGCATPARWRQRWAGSRTSRRKGAAAALRRRCARDRAQPVVPAALVIWLAEVALPCRWAAIKRVLAHRPAPSRGAHSVVAHARWPADRVRGAGMPSGRPAPC